MDEGILSIRISVKKLSYFGNIVIVSSTGETMEDIEDLTFHGNPLCPPFSLQVSLILSRKEDGRLRLDAPGAPQDRKKGFQPFQNSSHGIKRTGSMAMKKWPTCCGSSHC